ncbi:hypothetical protein WJX84_005396 [Apatococcus fuscideae]|uniref:Uncharacterized protein n=1 Tax=Apatococcus fuscideae TaxID=2026836 RepID=A0AAW1SJW3_9CHLO
MARMMALPGPLGNYTDAETEIHRNRKVPTPVALRSVHFCGFVQVFAGGVTSCSGRTRGWLRRLRCSVVRSWRRCSSRQRDCQKKRELSKIVSSRPGPKCCTARHRHFSACKLSAGHL